MGLIRSCGLGLDDGQFTELIERHGGSGAKFEIQRRLPPWLDSAFSGREESDGGSVSDFGRGIDRAFRTV